MAAVGFLDSLSVEEVEALRAASVRRAYGANVTLLHQADEGGPVVVLLGGRVKITMSQAGREPSSPSWDPASWSASSPRSTTARARRP